MHRLIQHSSRLAAVVMLLAALAIAVAPAALGDDWARDEVATRNLAQLDPAIQAAIVHRNLDAAPAPVADLPMAVVDDGFAWGAAAVGLGVGIAGMCALFGCVTLVRHDGRLRNA
jgi:hypothetical protein